MADVIAVLVAKYGLWSIVIDGAIIVLAALIFKMARERAD